MMIKSFLDSWTSEEIARYIEQFCILILFERILPNNTTAHPVIYGDISVTQQIELETTIGNKFAGISLSESSCNTINEFAISWYNQFVLHKKVFVINYRKEK